MGSKLTYGGAALVFTTKAVDRHYRDEGSIDRPSVMRL